MSLFPRKWNTGIRHMEPGIRDLASTSEDAQRSGLLHRLSADFDVELLVNVIKFVGPRQGKDG
jgi:hypothetical protein